MKNNLLKITGFRLGILVTFLIAGLYFSNTDFLNLIELKALDFRFKQRGKIEPDSPIVIVGIDDKSVKNIGRWPWPRSYIADLVDFMTEAQAKVVGFDITFAEPDLNSELRLVNDIISRSKKWDIDDDSFKNYIQDKKRLADNDQRLADAIKKNGKVILGYFFHTEETKERLDEETKKKMMQNLELIAPSKLSAIYYSSEQAQEFKFEEFNAADVNIKKISDACLGFGYFNVFPDIDGTVRWSPLVIKYQGELFPTLSLQILREYLRKEGEDEENVVVRVNEFGVYEVKLYDYMIPTDRIGRMMINYRGEEYTFKYHSFIDIINGEVPKEEFKDKMVIVGANAIGIYDLRVTPFSSVYPGVETHANIVDNILNRDSLVSPDWARGVDILTILLLGFAVAYIIPKHKASKSALVVLVLLFGYVTLNYFTFAYQYVWLNVVYPVFTILTSSLILYTYRFATEEREKRRIRGAFSHYVTESVVADMLKNPDKLKLGGEKKDLTVLFSDIRGFTTISEGLQPAELVHLLNEYLTAMTKIVFKYEGTLDKYMGDAIMAIYGAPQDMPDHPYKACVTALDMMRQLHNMQKEWEKKNMPKINIGIGINTGAMSVGNMGSNIRFDYTVMGDNVNLSSRLEGINKQYGTNIIMSEFTHELIKERLVCRQLDAVRVKGKKLPVKIYQLLGNKRQGDRRAAETIEMKKKYAMQRTSDRRKTETNEFELLREDFELALGKYFTREFEESRRMFEKIEQDYPDDKPTKLFLKRIQEFTAAPPPPDWDGTFTMKTK
jgi:adenylate cyclase